ncbi:MAG: class I SAM-dependent methyltransferase [Anaerolineae bacterium]|nr:class I SAM-dependent methyltransferase [Anaerolineae bacterium]
MRMVQDHYSRYDEQGRLSSSWGQVEYVRTQSIVRRYLAPPPGVVLDVGGAAGRYACWLASEGYEVHLVDPVLLHVEQARAASAAQPESPISTCRVGDARRLDFEDASATAVLLMGPLYHLVDRDHRVRALSEAFRVLRPGGRVFAAAISRFASAIDGMHSGYMFDPAFWQIVERDLVDGQHRNPTGKAEYFTDTFFHHPDELRSEVAAAGFDPEALLAVEGLAYVMPDLDRSWAVDDRRVLLLDLLARLEAEPSLLGASPHLMCVGRKG